MNIIIIMCEARDLQNAFHGYCENCPCRRNKSFKPRSRQVKVCQLFDEGSYISVYVSCCSVIAEGLSLNDAQNSLTPRRALVI